MLFFKSENIPSCSDCEYATLYIPYFSYPYSDPYCRLGHGLCKVDKLCDDFKLINSHYCSECVYFCNNHCDKKNIDVKDKTYSCVYFEVRL